MPTRAACIAAGDRAKAPRAIEHGYGGQLQHHPDMYYHQFRCHYPVKAMVRDQKQQDKQSGAAQEMNRTGKPFEA